MNMTITFIIFRELHRFYVFLSLKHLSHDASFQNIYKYIKKNKPNTQFKLTKLTTSCHHTHTRSNETKNNVKRAIKLTQFTNYGTPFDSLRAFVCTGLLLIRSQDPTKKSS